MVSGQSLRVGGEVLTSKAESVRSAAAHVGESSAPRIGRTFMRIVAMLRDGVGSDLLLGLATGTQVRIQARVRDARSQRRASHLVHRPPETLLKVMASHLGVLYCVAGLGVQTQTEARPPRTILRLEGKGRHANGRAGRDGVCRRLRRREGKGADGGGHAGRTREVLVEVVVIRDPSQGVECERSHTFSVVEGVETTRRRLRGVG